MKTLHIHDKIDSLGGVQTYLRRVRAALVEAGHRCVMVRLRAGARARTEGPDEFVCGTTVGPFRSTRAVRELTGIVRAENPDVVHLHSVFTTLGPGAVEALRRAVPTVYTLHDIRPLHAWGLADAGLRASPALSRWIDGRDRMPPLERLKRVVRAPLHRLLLPAYRRLDRFIVANSFFRDELLRLGFSPERVRLIPLFTAPAAPTGSAPGRKTSDDPGAPLVLFVGRLSEEKGILPFIRMLARLNGSGWRAEVVGAGPLEGEARALASSLGLDGRIRFAGWLPEAAVAGAYAACRVLVVPSLIPENFALVGLEALAAGRPVVGFRQAGLTEWLRQGVDGFLVEAGDLDGLAGRVQSLLDRPELAADLGRKGRAIALSEFSLERHLTSLLSAYRQAVERAA